MAQEQNRKRSNDLYILPPLIIMILIWAYAVVDWFMNRDVLRLIFFGYIGIFVGAGIGGYIAAPDRYRPYARHLVILLLGSLLLITAFVTDHGNMQIEGLFFALLAGGGSYIIIHYLIAKLIGPFIFGRVWCAWACWYSMIFDLLPYRFSHYRVNSKWGLLRYVHFAVSLLTVGALWFGLGYDAGGNYSGMVWFGMGVLFYYIIGIVMALVMKDNRAFCKYLCPIAVPLKVTSQFALLKISGTADHCANCEACVEMCPMNIRVKDYIMAGERVLSSECTLCLTCINVCPHDSLVISAAFDKGGKEYFDYDPSRGNREYKESIKTMTSTSEVQALPDDSGVVPLYDRILQEDDSANS